MQAEEPVGSEVSIYLDVQGATRRPVCLAHGKFTEMAAISVTTIYLCADNPLASWGLVSLLPPLPSTKLSLQEVSGNDE